MNPEDPLASIERGVTPLARVWFAPVARRLGVHYFPSEDPAALPYEDIFPMLAAFSLMTAAWFMAVPLVWLAAGLAFLSVHVWFIL